MSRHYGLMMRVHCIRSICRTLLPLMQENEKLYQLPGSELLLVLSGPETEGRLQHMVNILNSRQIHWKNTGLDMGYGAAWGVLMEIRNPATLVGAVKLAGGAILRTSSCAGAG